MAKTLTVANSVFMLSIVDLFPTPVQLKGYSADDVFSTEPVSPVETMMGVDAILSAGYVPTEKKQSIVLQADSDSNLIFENWYQAQELNQEAFEAAAFITLPSIGRIFTCVRGFLTTYAPTPDAKKLLQPRRYGITWEKIIGAPV